MPHYKAFSIRTIHIETIVVDVNSNILIEYEDSTKQVVKGIYEENTEPNGLIYKVYLGNEIRWINEVGYGNFDIYDNGKNVIDYDSDDSDYIPAEPTSIIELRQYV